MIINATIINTTPHLVRVITKDKTFEFKPTNINVRVEQKTEHKLLTAIMAASEHE